MISLLRRLRAPSATSGGNRALVLMYHGVGSVDIDPWGLFVSPANFESHLAVLSEQARPLPLTELVAANESGSLPPGAVAVTADDGYANIATTARPVLEKYQVPATLFALSAPLREGGEYWWDRLAAIVLVPGTLPDELHLGLDQPVTIELGPATTYTTEQWQADHRYCDGDRAGPRMEFYRRLWSELLPLDHSHRCRILDAVGAWAGSPAGSRESHRNMTVEELQKVDGDVITVGGHTLTHPLLPELPVREQRREIVDNKRHLESILDRPVDAFSYPFGGHDKKTVAAVRSAGYRVAVTTKPTAVSERSHRLRVGRFDVKNWDGGEFARRLEQWLRS